MNILRPVLLAILFLGLSHLSYAQNISNIQRGQRGYSPPPRPYTQYAGEPVDPQEILAERMPVFKETFDLDNFEYEVMKNILSASYEEQASISNNTDLNYEDKMALIDKQREKTRKELLVILTEEEATTFFNMDFDKKKKRKKKNKDG
ncbi:hypothetical protein [Croceiramulus getboli]|nr:hypothetical protein P8624_00335 [Flavobacteriaceae bacterium YJPT1-3]